MAQAQIAILVPVLNRPDNARPLVDSIRSVTQVPHQILFLCSPGDEAQFEAALATGADVIVVDFPAARSDYPKKMQVGYEETKEPFLFLGSDDIEFTAGWDSEVLAVTERTGADVIATNDQANRQVITGQFGTHCLVRREYVDKMGASADGKRSFISLAYDHNFCDRELCHVAQYRQRYAYAKEAVVRHRHPIWKTARSDPTYAKGKLTFREDQRTFLSRAHLWRYHGLNVAEQRAARRERTRRG